MAKFYGRVGYAICGEYPEGSGIYVDDIIERRHMGELLRNFSKWEKTTDQLNDNLTLNNRISIVADAFAYCNFNQIKYAEYMGVLWKVISVDASERPRLILTLGGEWNGEQT